MSKRNLNFIFNKMVREYPFVFIDVGAMGGIPLKWRDIQDRMKVIAFEPDEREFCKLKSSNSIKYFNYALHNRAEDLKLYITKVPSKSSILRPNIDFLSQYEDAERFQVIREETILASNVRDIDSVIKENSLKDVDFIKIDTQGSELYILQGGQKKLLPQIFGVEVEVEFVEMYKDQPLFRDVDAILAGNGFKLMDLRRVYWKRKDYYNYKGKGELIFADALYFKKYETLARDLATLKDREQITTKLCKAVLICMIYGLFDYAVKLVRLGLELECFTKAEAGSMISEIKRDSSRGLLSNIYLNRRLYKILTAVLRQFRPPSHLGWADGDQEIGNIRAI